MRYLLHPVSLLALSCLLILPVKAQEQIQWLVNNTQSPTVVPLYAKQSSPFPYRQDTSQAADINQAQAQLDAQVAFYVTQLRTMVNTRQAIQPDVSGFHIKAIIQGPQGPRVLVQDSWLKEGQKIQVRSQATQAYLAALQQLRQLKPQTPDPLTNKYHLLTLTVQKITKDGFTLAGTTKSLFIPFRQE